MTPSEGLAAQDAQFARLAHGLEVARAERNAAIRERDDERRRLTEALTERETVLLKFVEQRDEARQALERIASDVLSGLAGAGIATPAKGYVAEPWAVAGDIARLVKERDAACAEVSGLRYVVASATASEARVRRVLKAMKERHPGEVDVEWTADTRSCEGAGLCLEQCSGRCGFGHLRGCDAIKEWIRDNRAEASHVYECAAVEPKPTPKLEIQPAVTPPDRPRREPRAHADSPALVAIAPTCNCGASTFEPHDPGCACLTLVAEVPDEREHERSAAVELALKDLGAKP